jgi:Holliday junction DNA helicase RuvB
MHLEQDTWAASRWSAFSCVRDERGTYEANEATPTAVRFELRDGLSPAEVDQEIARGCRAGDIGHRTVAFYLAECADRGLHQALGHPSVIPYAVKRHGIPRRCARDLVATGRALRNLVKIDAAFIRGDVVWSKVRAIVKVAEPATEDAWLAFARTRTIDEVETEAAIAKKGDEPRKSRKGLHEVRFTMQLRVGATLHEQYLLARKKLSAELGHEAKDEEVAGALLDNYLRGRGDDARAGDSLYRVVLDLRPGEGAGIRSDDGPVPVDDATAEAICCDAGVLAQDGRPDPRYSPPISDGLRERIRARDGYRCVACSSRFEPHVHHIVFRERGGTNAMSNLATLCRACHALVHGGFLTIEGRAPHALVFRNASGEQLTAPAIVVARTGEPPLQIVTASGPIGPPGATEAATPSRPVQLADVPELIDSDWMARHGHLVSADPKRTVLRFETGHPADAPAAASSDAGAGGGPIGPLAADPREKPRSLHRPDDLDGVVGQSAVVSALRLAVAAATASGEMPDHVLLTGRPGLGKTTLARAFARELGGRLRVIDASTLDHPLTLIGNLLDARDRDVIFLDEIHALPQRVAESLYGALEDGRIALQFSDGLRTRPVTFALPKVTFVGATTDPGMVPEPLLDRFPMRADLDPYGKDDLAEIVRRAARRDGIAIGDEGADVLAGAAGGCARTAIALFLWMRRSLRAAGRTTASAADARQALVAAQIDARGLGPVHRRILEILARHRRPMAVRRLARAAGLTLESFRRLYEPALFDLAAIVPTARGMSLASPG